MTRDELVDRIANLIRSDHWDQVGEEALVSRLEAFVGTLEAQGLELKP